MNEETFDQEEVIQEETPQEPELQQEQLGETVEKIVDEKPINPAPELVPNVWTSEEVLKRAADFVCEQYRKVKSDHDSRVLKWLDWDKAYQNIRERKPGDGAANIVDPEPFVIVDTLNSNVVEAFFSQDPPFSYEGMESKDDKQAELMTHYRADHLRRIGIRDKFQRSTQQLITYGTCVVKTPWRKEVTWKVIREKVTEVNPFTGQPEEKTVTRKIPFPKFDDTDWEFVPLWDFYPVGRASTIEGLDGCIHRVTKSFDDLKANERKVEIVDGIPTLKGIYYNLDSLKPMTSPKVQVYEYHGKIPRYVVTGNEDDKYTCFEGVITAAIGEEDWAQELFDQQRAIKTGAIVWQIDQEEQKFYSSAAIRCQENPYWSGDRPFLVCQWTPLDDEFYGIGVIQPIKELWDELNDTRNQLVDNKTLMLRMPMLEDVHANLQRNVHLTAPHARIKCDDINGVKPLPIQNFQAEGWRNVAAIKDDMRRASAAVDSMQGVPLSENTSATEFSAIQQQAGVRLKSHIKTIDEKLFKPFLERSYQYDMQFAEFERFIKVLGEKGGALIRVRPEDIWGTFDIVTNGVGQVENNVIKTNKLINFLSIVSRIPNIANIPEIIKEVWTSMGFPAGQADKIINAPINESAEDIEAENIALMAGEPVKVLPGENHQMHIQIHGKKFEQLRSIGAITPELEQRFKSHIMEHGLQLQSQMGVVNAMEGSPQDTQGQLNQIAQNGGNSYPLKDVSTQPMQTDSPLQEVRYGA